jgi:Na+/serine symporter
MATTVGAAITITITMVMAFTTVVITVITTTMATVIMAGADGMAGAGLILINLVITMVRQELVMMESVVGQLLLQAHRVQYLLCTRLYTL